MKQHPGTIRNATHHESIRVDPWPWGEYIWQVLNAWNQAEMRPAGLRHTMSQSQRLWVVSSAGDPWSITTQGTRFKEQRNGDTNGTILQVLLIRHPEKPCIRWADTRLNVDPSRLGAFYNTTNIPGRYKTQPTVNIFLLLERLKNMSF